MQPDPSIPLTDPVHANTNPRADAEAHRIFEHLRTFISPESIDGHYGVATGYAMRTLSLQAVRAVYANMLNIRDWATSTSPRSRPASNLQTARRSDARRCRVTPIDAQ